VPWVPRADPWTVMQRPHRRHGADAAGHLLPVPQLIGGRRLALPPSPRQNTRAPDRYRLAAQAMQTPAIVAVAVLLSLAGATGVTLLLRPAQVAAPEPNGVSAEEFRAAVHRLDEALQRLQLDLASRSIAANPGTERAAVPTLSDEQIDAAMQRYMLKRVDDNHWQARFSKAVGYTFWPPFLGKNKDALAQFDRLVQQQDNMPVQPEQAQTYVFYGNLLEQGGNAQKARDIWQRGLARHPDNAELRRRLGQ